MTVLFINTCVREQSRTLRLAQYFLEKWNDPNVIEVNPEAENIHSLDAKILHIRDHALYENDLNHPVLKYAKQFAEADTIVIAAPYWDLSFPAALKVYLERVNAVGVTFFYDETGNPHGLCKAKRLVYIATAGGPLISDLYGYGYVRQLCETFYEIPKTVHFIAENLDMPQTDVEAALAQVRSEMDVWMKQCA